MSRRFAVAARELERSPGGVGRWLREICEAWRVSGRDRGIALYVEHGLPADVAPGRFEVRATGPGRGATAWEQWTLAGALRRDRPRAVLGPNYAVPLLAHGAAVVALHDLSFEVRPEWFRLREGTRRRLLARASARRAARIVAGGRFAAAEVARLYGVPERRLVVLRDGVSPRFAPLRDEERLAEARARLGAEGEVVLAVGSLLTRRRVPELIDGFARVARERPRARLVLVGENRTYPRLDVDALLRRAGVDRRTTWLERVSEEDLVALYSLAHAAVYLSEYEGFGLPPLEAAACGAPVVASDIPALRENLAGHAVLLERSDGASLAAALGPLLDAPPAAGLRPPWLERFSWAETAEAVARALEEAAG